MLTLAAAAVALAVCLLALLTTTLLSAFDGTNPNGVWRLYVVDYTVGSLGGFAGGWSLTIKAKVRR